jgi:hypothetical protein
MEHRVVQSAGATSSERRNVKLEAQQKNLKNFPPLCRRKKSRFQRTGQPAKKKLSPSGLASRPKKEPES